VCYGLPSGDIKVEVALGACTGYGVGNAYTGKEVGATLVIMEAPSRDINGTVLLYLLFDILCCRL